MPLSPYPHLVSIAPMMNRTDTHFRYFVRLLTRHTLLYTEMVTCPAILYGNAARILAYHPKEHPLILQLGGSDPKQLHACAKIAEQMGYDGINLNAGCPSKRAMAGGFGACLMKAPQQVRACLEAMQEAVDIPVSLKTRIGVDHLDQYTDFKEFIRQLSPACSTFIIHARKAWLKGVSPKANRNIPPLRYDFVHALKQDFPQLHIVLNGGLESTLAIQNTLCAPKNKDTHANDHAIDGIMIGRAAYKNPYFLSQIDSLIYKDPHPVPSRDTIAKAMQNYLTQCPSLAGVRATTRHLFGLFYGTKDAKKWKHQLLARIRA